MSAGRSPRPSVPADLGQSPSEPGRLLTAEDLAALLQVPKTWVYAEARAGRIPYVSLGRYRRFRLEAIVAWLDGRERGPVGPRDRRSTRRMPGQAGDPEADAPRGSVDGSVRGGRAGR